MPEKYSPLLFALCLTLFVLMNPVGYFLAGLLTSNHGYKKGWEMDMIGILLIWPAALIIERRER